MSCIVAIIVVIASYAIDLLIVGICYAAIAWAFGIEFQWPIAFAFSLVLMFIMLIIKAIKNSN